MQTNNKNNIHKLVSYFLVGIIVLLNANRAIYTHAHIQEDGTIIHHAHPYEKSSDSHPFQSHKHTNSQLLYYQNIEILFLTLSILFSVLLVYEYLTILIFQINKGFSFKPVNLYKGRAPPLIT